MHPYCPLTLAPLHHSRSTCASIDWATRAVGYCSRGRSRTRASHNSTSAATRWSTTRHRRRATHAHVHAHAHAYACAYLHLHACSHMHMQMCICICMHAPGGRHCWQQRVAPIARPERQLAERGGAPAILTMAALTIAIRTYGCPYVWPCLLWPSLLWPSLLKAMPSTAGGPTFARRSAQQHHDELPRPAAQSGEYSHSTCPHHSLLIAHCLLLTTHYPLLTTHHLVLTLLTTCYSLLTTHYLLPDHGGHCGRRRRCLQAK